MAGAKGEVSVQEPTRAEATLLRRSAEARATVPDLEMTADVDMSVASALPFAATTLLVRACALALREVPRANGAYRDGHYELYSRVNVGVAMFADEGPATPTVFDADAKTPAALEDELAELGERARAGQLTPPELGGATFTLLDLGTFEITAATPLPTPPHAAAIAAGQVRERPAVKHGAIVPCAAMTLTLAADSRILYGAHAAGFLSRVRMHLEEPTA